MKTKNKTQGQNLKEDTAFKYLHKQFPWFSESEILKAIDLKGSNADQVIKYLSSRGSKPKVVDQD